MFMEMLCEGHDPAVLVVIGCCEDRSRRRLVVVNPLRDVPWLLQMRLEHYQRREWKVHPMLCVWVLPECIGPCHCPSVPTMIAARAPAEVAML